MRGIFVREIADIDKLQNVINKQKQIVIYGAGIIGQGVFCLLNKMGVGENIIGFAVSPHTDHLNEYMGKPIKCIDEYDNGSTSVLIAVKQRYLEDVVKNIDKNNAYYINIKTLKKLFKEAFKDLISQKFIENWDKIDLSDEEFVTFCIRQIRRSCLDFEVNIVDHCNLNCQCCNHFSPIAPASYLEYEVFKKDLEQIARLTEGNVGRIWLIGGEPLLHPNIVSFLYCARELFPQTHITLDTNGTLLLKQNEGFWEALRQTGIELTLTKYPISIDYEAIDKKMKLENVEYAYTLSSKVLKTTYHLPLDLDAAQDEIESYMRCWHANECVTLRNGRIYTCPIAAHAHHFNEYFNKELYVGDANSISIYDVKDIEEILEFLKEPIPFCKHCNIKGYTFDLPWNISKKEISEWT